MLIIVLCAHLKHYHEYNIRVSLKTTEFEYIQKDRIVYDLYINFALVVWYKYYIINKINLNPVQFEIRKETVFKQGYKTRALIFYTTISKK